jgi:hypothetical protein
MTKRQNLFEFMVFPVYLSVSMFTRPFFEFYFMIMAVALSLVPRWKCMDALDALLVEPTAWALVSAVPLMGLGEGIKRG